MSSSTAHFPPFRRFHSSYHHNFILFRLKIEILDCIILIFAVEEMLSVILIWYSLYYSLNKTFTNYIHGVPFRLVGHSHFLGIMNDGHLVHPSLPQVSTGQQIDHELSNIDPANSIITEESTNRLIIVDIFAGLFRIN